MSFQQSDIEASLGVDQIRAWLKARCKTEAGQAWVDKAAFSDRFDLIQTLLEQTGEMIAVSSAGDIPNRHFYDLEPLLVKIKVDGTFMEGEEFLTVSNSIEALSEWLVFLKKSERYPRLSKMSQGIEVDDTVVSDIERSIDRNGEVKDGASAELATIRKRIGAAEKSARSVIARILKQSISSEFSNEESQVTLRDGRLVLPIRAEFKRSIPGLIHDESATGQTVFLEPAEALELNNEVRDLKNRERREVIRILISLADELRKQYDELISGSRFLAKLDFIHAKSSWAKDFDCLTPKVEKSQSTRLLNAFHPILWHGHQKDGKKIVPLQLALSKEQRMIVVSGPNAGGKSVALKTLGLLQYLVQCGFPVPVSEESVFGVFSEILLDIGDTQSIEDDLSTYSAHLTSMKQFLSRASKRTLILIDEFGKGTEPRFGGAIAEAILKGLNESKSYGVITTHYQNLKDLADASQGMVNGAMKFDVGRLEPLFELEIGKPGSSFAFEIATKIGLPKEVIKDAKELMGVGAVDFDQSLSKLEKEKQKYEKLAQRLERDQKQAVQVKKDYEELRVMVEEEKKRVIKEAKQEAKRIIDQANKQIEGTIREIKESNADKVKTQKAREKLKHQSDQLKVEQSIKSVVKISEGDQVKVEGQEGVGEVLKIKGKEVEVQFGLLKSFVKMNRLEKVGGPKKKEPTAKKGGYSQLESVLDFSHELSILGMRAEQALPALDGFIDKAIMIGVNEARVLHGKGHGILRDLVRNHLSDHPHIESVSDEHVDRGGSGISIVKFR